MFLLPVLAADLLANLQQCSRGLEELSAQLVVHLDKKRAYFPRLFFVSDDQLLDILSQTKTPDGVQPHFRSMFDGIHRVRCCGRVVLAFVTAAMPQLPDVSADGVRC